MKEGTRALSQENSYSRDTEEGRRGKRKGGGTSAKGGMKKKRLYGVKWLIFEEEKKCG